jgi:hypothetical protein
VHRRTGRSEEHAEAERVSAEQAFFMPA